MLLILLASIYISFICLVWGVMILYFLKKITGEDEPFPHISILCLSGFSAITVIAGILSLFVPLGGWWVQLIILLPCILFAFIPAKKAIPWHTIMAGCKISNPVMIFLLFAAIVLLLVMGSWKVIHPDTLGYHAQTIQWIEKYKAVPGLVNLNTRFGFQGLWYPVCALFSFKFMGGNAITYINTAMLIWYLFFLMTRISAGLQQKGNTLNSFFWLGLFAISLWSYTQVRLAATTASPDFIAALIVWSVFYLLLQKNVHSKTNWLLISLLSFTAVTIKLSVAPLLVIAVFAAFLFLKEKNLKLFFIQAAIAFLTFSPFIARNIITTGYLIFPSTVADIVNVDWKYNKQMTLQSQDYIQAYARTECGSTKEEIEAVKKMTLSEWLPVWWRIRSLADKTIIILFLLSVVTAIVRMKKIVSAGNSTKIGLLSALAGIVFWFIYAPDPRFGFGFITGFMGIIMSIIFSGKKVLPEAVMKKLLIAAALIICLIVTVYIGYRFKNFYSSDQWLRPMGPEKVKYKTTTCGEIKINVQLTHLGCGDAPVPCAYDSCGVYFLLRGNKVTAGFRPK